MPTQDPHATSILGLVPARGGSKGIPRKNARKLAGRPLVAHTFEACEQSRLLTRTILSTDDPEIAALAEGYAVDVPFLRPPHLAADDTPTRAVVADLLDRLSERGEAPDIVVLLQPTAPLRRGIHIDEAVSMLRGGDWDSVVSVSEVPAHFHPRWQLVLQEAELSLITGEPLRDIVTRRQDLTTTYYRNGAIYAFHSSAFRRTGSFYGERCAGYVMPTTLSINIDTPEEWSHAEMLLQRSDDSGQ